MEHAGLAPHQLLVHAGVADNEQTPVEGIMDGDDQEVLGKYVHALDKSAGNVTQSFMHDHHTVASSVT